MFQGVEGLKGIADTTGLPLAYMTVQPVLRDLVVGT